MGCDVNIMGPATVNCGDSCVCGFLKNDENPQRINKCDVSVYEPVDVTDDPEGKNYQIRFTLKNGMVIIWKFFTAANRDTVLQNVDIAMSSQIM